MLLPYLKEVQSASKKYSVVFRGINYGEATQDGEFAETYNLSTDQYPCITQRAARIEAGEYTKPSTLHAKGKLLVIDGTDVLYGDKKVGEVTEGKKQTATVGNYIVIFPDKKYYKVPTEDDEEGKFGDMEETYSRKCLNFGTSSISMEMKYESTGLRFLNGKSEISRVYQGKYTGLEFRGSSISSSKGDFGSFLAGDAITITGCSRSENNHSKEIIIKEATTTKLTFDEVSFYTVTESNEVTITRKKEKFPFAEGDKVTISGSSNADNNRKEPVLVKEVTDSSIILDCEPFMGSVANGLVTITRIVEEKFNFEVGDAVTIEGCSNGGNNKTSEIIIRGKEDHKLIFDDNTFTEAIEAGEVTITRTVPDLDFICENNYRLWGTHGNTIYSSKYSDPFNFKVFDGLANDSYFIDVGSEGEFTGCIPYSSHICFFKENALHKLYGTKPSNFQITTVNVYGVQSGSEKSMQIVNEQLLYKGVGGVYSYTGGVPELISDKFGNNRYSEAVACCDGEKYYISMKQGDTWNLFVYDVLKNIWLREDDTHAVDMAFHNGKVYVLDTKGGLFYIDKTADRSDIEWGATFCTMNETMNERKGYSKFHLRMDLSAGAWLAVDIKTDNDLQWKQVYTTHNQKAKTVSIPIMPTRCDSIDIRLRGKGKSTIRAFIREFSVGSDV